MKKQILGNPRTSAVPRPPQRRGEHWAPCAAETVPGWQAPGRPGPGRAERAERARLALGNYEGSPRI